MFTFISTFNLNIPRYNFTIVRLFNIFLYISLYFEQTTRLAACVGPLWLGLDSWCSWSRSWNLTLIWPSLKIRPNFQGPLVFVLTGFHRVSKDAGSEPHAKKIPVYKCIERPRRDSPMLIKAEVNLKTHHISNFFHGLDLIPNHDRVYILESFKTKVYELLYFSFVTWHRLIESPLGECQAILEKR